MKTADSIEAAAAQSASHQNKRPSGGKLPRRDGARIAAWQWKKGQSGNPGGKPKTDVAAEIARAVFENNRDGIYKAFVKTTYQGNAYAFKELSDRAYGKLKERTELTGVNGGPLEFHQVSNDTLEARLKQILVDLGVAAQVDAVGSGVDSERVAAPQAKK